MSLSLGGAVYDPNDPDGRLLFNVLAMVAEVGSDLIRMRTCEGMRTAKAKGHLRGKQPKLKPRQEAHLVSLFDAGSTLPVSWPTCSESAAPPSTEPWPAAATEPCWRHMPQQQLPRHRYDLTRD